MAACVAAKKAARDGSFKQHPQSSTVTTPKDSVFEVILGGFKRKVRVTPIQQNGVTQFEVRTAFNLIHVKYDVFQ